MTKILSIGNSFAQDAQRWLHDICAAAGVEMLCVNLMYGGCSLQQHWDFHQNGDVCYDYEVNGRGIGRRVSLTQALGEEEWDVITLQQVSRDSGRPQSYFPYIYQLRDLVKEKCPNAKIYIHQTWSYEGHGAFTLYNCDQHEMHRRISDACEMATKVIDAGLLPSGKVVQALRDNHREFDPKRGGKSLHRDGYHLSLTYGRYAAAATWFVTLFGGDITQNTFVPEVEEQPVDESLLQKIRETVQQICG